MSDRSVVHSGNDTELTILSMLSEGIPLITILGFWIVLSIPAIAWLLFLGAGGFFRLILQFIPVFFFTVGIANLLLYVLVRANTLTRK